MVMPRLWLSGMGIRYWDGRGQLGVMVKSGRELARKIVTYTRIPEDETEDSVHSWSLHVCRARVHCAVWQADLGGVRPTGTTANY
jgi:predicted membrane chloride channel (bestrophin family)